MSPELDTTMFCVLVHLNPIYMTQTLFFCMISNQSVCKISVLKQWFVLEGGYNHSI